MADNVTVTDGAYTADVLTDDCTTGHAQIVKLAISTDGSATLIPANGTDGMLVNLGANNDVTQATAANLNMTEASAAAIKTAVEIIDDWDESDRAKVNVIVGQAGITAAAGSVAANTPRVTLASDDPAVALLGTIDADTGGILTSVQTLDNAISGSEMQVDVVGALPAGTNAIGKLAANSGVDIGDVDVTSIAAGDNNIGNVDVVTLPTRTRKLAYAASAAQTQTNLDGIASSATWVAGWESGAIDNSSNLYLDYRIHAVLQLESAGLAAGEARMYLVAEQSDATWPDAFDGTESTETITDTEQRDAICRLAAVSATDTGASEFVYLTCPSAAAVFNGTLPRKFVIFITQSSGTTLETTGDPNQVYVAGVAETWS